MNVRDGYARVADRRLSIVICQSLTSINSTYQRRCSCVAVVVLCARASEGRLSLVGSGYLPVAGAMCGERPNK